MARDNSRIPAARVRRGDRVTLRGRREEVKAVRDLSSSGRSVLVLVLKAARPVRVDARELVSAERRRRAAKRSWWQ